MQDNLFYSLIIGMGLALIMSITFNVLLAHDLSVSDERLQTELDREW